MKIYVATKWENKERARAVMYTLIELGHIITYDWTSQEQESSLQAAADIQGVVDADALVGIFEEDFPYKGALIELGAALGLGKPIYVLGNAPITQSMFFKHPLVKKIGSVNEV